jgi:hypothetical protein
VCFIFKTEIIGMNNHLQNCIKFFIMILHFLGVAIVTLIILFSEDIWLIIAIIISQTLVFIQLVLINGCIISKYEHMLGDSSFNLSDVCKNMFFLSKEMPQADFEKMIVGIPLLLCIIKLGFMLLPADISSDIQKKYFTLASLKIPNTDIKKAYSALKLPKV